ncbi:hypothetical protein [Catellatospora sp. TT07R-123]|uniref:hypothetical protein n=1 Tax=Catellatospora sp. TT07R-123 TaxID=2733863 RepID=UPI001BB36A45|nr:hypothetical protein [Catellatospora sp. TT07R-123]
MTRIREAAWRGAGALALLCALSTVAGCGVSAGAVPSAPSAPAPSVLPTALPDFRKLPNTVVESWTGEGPGESTFPAVDEAAARRKHPSSVLAVVGACLGGGSMRVEFKAAKAQGYVDVPCNGTMSEFAQTNLIGGARDQGAYIFSKRTSGHVTQWAICLFVLPAV